MQSIEAASLDPELISHYSRYLCVLTSGYVEQSVKELVIHYCRRRSAEPIVRYVSQQVSQLRNINRQKLRTLIESLDSSWWTKLENSHSVELEALDSIATVRNAISHGQDTGMTIATIRQYFSDVNAVLSDLCNEFDPEE
jgi:hypothetical protein